MLKITHENFLIALRMKLAFVSVEMLTPTENLFEGRPIRLKLTSQIAPKMGFTRNYSNSSGPNRLREILDEVVHDFDYFRRRKDD